MPLQDLVREKGAVIFAYPKANTTGCTKQATGFRDNYADIDKAGELRNQQNSCHHVTGIDWLNQSHAMLQSSHECTVPPRQHRTRYAGVSPLAALWGVSIA